MDRQILNITANEQILTVDEPIHISTNKVNYIEAHFDLGTNWSGYDSVRAVWFNDFYCISTVLDSQGVCFVPSEVMRRNGKVKVNLVGSISENDVLTDRLTSYPIVAVLVDCNAMVTGAETSPITPSQFEQYVAIVRDLVDSVKDIDHIELNSDYTLTIYYSDGTSDTTTSIRGADGNGIASVTKTGTSGLVDTYTITFTDGQTTTFTVTNGAKGDTGNGIQSIAKTSTVGLVDTYTITYTNGTTTTFTVTNGEKGDKGDTGEVSLDELSALLPTDTASGAIASFPDGQSVIPAVSVLAQIEPIQSGSGTPSPDNVRPISGHTECVTSRTGEDIQTDFDKICATAGNGLADRLYTIGQTFNTVWTDIQTSTSYDYPMHINRIADVELEGGAVTQGVFMQAEYTHPFGVQFSHQRAFLACPNGLSAGTYYFTIESNWGSNVHAGDVVCFTLTQNVPSGGRIAGCYGAPDQAKANWLVYSYSADGKTVIETATPTFEASGTDLGVMKSNKRNGNLNSCQEMAYGHNRWKTSAIRQYLNSDKGVGAWWTAQDEWDIAPDQLTTKAGFLSGWPEELVNVLKEVKVVTYPNTVYDDTGGNTPDITYDRVFLPSLEQMYIEPQKAGEGEYHEYWKRRLGRTTPAPRSQTYPELIHYAVENHTSAQYVRLRSAYRGYASYTWTVNSSGYVHINNASSALRFSPLVVLTGTASATYTTTLGRTVYGGTLDVVSGELTVDRVVDTMSITSMYAPTSGGNYNPNFDFAVFSASEPWLSNIQALMRMFTSDGSYFPNVNFANVSFEGAILVYSASSKQLCVSIAKGSTLAQAQARFNGVQLCYELATPQTYQLDPQTIDLLLGDNNVWTDCGSVEVTYKADIQRWVLKKLSE